MLIYLRKGRKMRNKVGLALVMVVVMFLSPIVSSAYAGEIASQKVTNSEDAQLTAQSVEALSSPAMYEEAGGDEALAAVGIFFIFLILCAAAAGG